MGVQDRTQWIRVDRTRIKGQRQNGERKLEKNEGIEKVHWPEFTKVNKAEAHRLGRIQKTRRLFL